jgi:hypothetical protein
MNSGNIYLRNHGYQIASQSTKTVISETFFLSNGCFLKEVTHLITFLSAILVAARVGEEEVAGAMHSALELLWASSPADTSMMGRS